MSLKFIGQQKYSSRSDNESEGRLGCSGHSFVSVIVCTLGHRPSLEPCLASLAAQRCQHYEILVVLNGDPDDQFARRVAPYPVQLFYEPKIGVCNARNRAVAATRGEILCFVDDDVLADPGWIHETIRGFADPQVACVTGRVKLQGALLSKETLERSYESKQALSEWTLDNSDPNWYRTVLGPYIGFGCNMSFRKDFLEATLFPEYMGAGAIIAATDEAFMFFQVLKHDLRIRHLPAAMVTHIYENDSVKQKTRMKQVCSALVALHFKLLMEETGFRLATLKLISRAIIRRFTRLVRAEGVFRKSHEPLSIFERCFADLQGVLVYWRYRSSRSAVHAASRNRYREPNLVCRSPKS